MEILMVILMGILKMFGGLAILIIMPILYITSILLMLVITRWIYMFIGVIMGDKSVIDEFDCREKEPYWSKLFGFQARQDKRYPLDDDDTWQHRSWRDDGRY